MRARYLLLLAASFVGLTVACGDPTPQTTGDSPAGPVAPPSAEAVSLHERLFAAADKGDVDGFKATLTPESVEMLDRWFELQQRKLESNASWADFLKLHADLPAQARKRAPYPVDGGKLDLASHPDGRFFEDATQQLAKMRVE